jgi:cell wall-associated NlpC family hydrolase
VEEEAAFVATAIRRVSIRRAIIGLTAGALAITLAPSVPSMADPGLTAAQAQERVDALYEEAEAAAEEHNDARLAVKDAERTLSTVKSRIAREEKILKAIQKDIGVFAAASYRNGGVDSSLELILSEDPAAFLERTSSLDQFARGQGAALRKAAVSKQRLAQDRKALDQQVAALTEVQTKARAAKDRIDEKVAAAEDVVKRLKAEERTRYLAAQARRAAESARASREALRSIPEPSTSSGSSSSKKSSSSDDEDDDFGGGAGSGRAGTAVAAARAQVGDRYVYGAGGPSSFDCSGLTSWAWRKAGVSLPHQSRAQYSATSRVSKGNLQPGDLVFFYSPISHVGMYIGGGMMVHAANPRSGVRVDSISSGYYASAYVGGGRV